MANLKRYRYFKIDTPMYNEGMNECEDGEYVKFDDIKDFLPSTSNNTERVQSLCGAIRNAISGYNSPSLIAELYSVLEKFERNGTKPVS